MNEYMKPEIEIVDFASEAITGPDMGNASGGAAIISLD